MPKDWEIISDSKEYEILHEGDFKPQTPEIEQKVDAIWQRALVKNPGSMHNSVVLAFRSAGVGRGKTTVRCIRAEYRYYYAGVCEPELGFGIEPVAVSGVIEVDSADGPAIVAARRGKTVNLYPGCLEFIPSGGIDEDSFRPDGKADYLSQFEREFSEESGLDVSAIKSIEPFAFIHDIRGKVYDICAVIRIESDADDLAARLSSDGEYSEYVAIPRNELEDYIRKHEREFVPTSLALAKTIKHG
jgi:hypothetical protein